MKLLIKMPKIAKCLKCLKLMYSVDSYSIMGLEASRKSFFGGKDRRKKSEVGMRKSEDGWQRTEGRSQRTAGRERKEEDIL